MLVEYGNVLQHEGEPHRRWFEDEYFDLYVWVSESGDFIGFQLCYDVQSTEKALTFMDGTYLHTGIDQGNPGPNANYSPVLVADGSFDKDRIMARFERESGSIDPSVRQFVLEKLREC